MDANNENQPLVSDQQQQLIILKDCKATIIGHNYDKNSNELFFIINIMSFKENYKKKIERSFVDFVSLEKSLIKQKLYIFNRIIEDDYDPDYNYANPNSQQIQETENTLKKFLNEVFERQDILQTQHFQDFLQISDDTKYLLPPQMLIRLKVNLELSISEFHYLVEYGLLAVTIQNSTMLSKLGRVWSIIEPEVLGGINIYTRENIPNKIVPGFKLIYKKEYESKILSLTYLKQFNKYVYGFHDGQLEYVNFNVNNPELSKSGAVQISKENILFLQAYNDALIIMVTSTSVKILNGDKLEPVGGGSLQQRLGSYYISAVTFEEKNFKLYLGIYSFIVNKKLL